MILALVACSGPVPETTLYSAPELHVSTDFIDLGEVAHGEVLTRTITVENRGELPLGLASVDIGPGQPDNWTLEPGAASCEEEIPGALAAGCSQEFLLTVSPVDVGEIWGSVVIRTADGPGDDPLLRGNADLVRERAVVELTAFARLDQGRVQVSPRTVDFGSVWQGTEAVAYVDVANHGDGPLTLSEPQVDSCVAPFSLHPTWVDGAHLSPDDKALLEVRFNPTDNNARGCSLRVVTDDAEFPELDVVLKGNVWDNPHNTPPRVQILGPQPGTRAVSGVPLTLQLKVTDAEQPADSLYCRVRSASVLQATVANCTPSGPNGLVELTLDHTDWGQGTDTLVVTAVDAEQLVGRASVPVVLGIEVPHEDDDGDGWGEDDCDDTQIAAYPHAIELDDGVDNDCDGLVDEETWSWDDDGDGWTEHEGDCDDANADSFPGAQELADGQDNNCDGTVDEGTALYDDDGDGVTLSDCDDSDPDVFPGAIEYCNGIDDDCDNKVDDDCIELDHAPLQVGVVLSQPSGVYAGQTSALSLTLVDLDDDALAWTWTVDAGTLDDPTRETPVWTAPAEVGEEGLVVSVVGYAEDPDGNDAWAFGRVTVYPDGHLDREHVVVTYPEESSGCTHAPGAASVLLLGLASLLARRRGNGLADWPA